MKLENKMNHRQKFAFGAIVTIFAAWFALFAASGLAQRSAPTQTNAVKTNSNTKRRQTRTAAMSNMMLTNANMSSTPEPTSIVRGRAYYEDSGRPIRRVAILLVGSKTGGGREAVGLTDNNGEFVIKSVPRGVYTAMITAPGILNLFSYADLGSKTEEEGLGNSRQLFDKITVDGVNDTNNVAVRATRGASITGRVFYGDGEVAAGINVEVLRKQDDKFISVIDFSRIASLVGGGGMFAKTDDRGIYRAIGLPKGEYIVRVNENASHGNDDGGGNIYNPFTLGLGGSLLTTYFPNATDAKDATVISLEIGQETSEINFNLIDRRLFTISGTVTARNTRQPVKNAQISIVKKDNTSSFTDRLAGDRGQFLTDENGNWNLKNIPAGTYTMKIKPQTVYDYDSGSSMMSNSGMMSNTSSVPQKPKPLKLASIEREITISDGDLNDVKIELSTGGRISGTVSSDGKPLPLYFTVQANDEKGESLASDTKYDGGNVNPNSREFSLDGLSTGKVFLDINISNYGNDKTAQINYLKNVKVENQDVLAKGIDIAENVDLKNVQIVIGTDGGKLKAKISTSDKEKSVANIRAVLVPTDANKQGVSEFRQFVETDANGEFEVSGAPLEYFVIFLRGSDKPSSVNQNWIRERSQNAEKVTIKPNDTTTTNLTLP